MVKVKTKKKISRIFFWLGASIVAITHIIGIFFGIPQTQIISHSTLNLFAYILIVYGWFLRK